MLCESQTDYVYNIEVYTGKTDGVLVPELGTTGSAFIGEVVDAPNHSAQANALLPRQDFQQAEKQLQVNTSSLKNSVFEEEKSAGRICEVASVEKQHHLRWSPSV